MEVQGDLAQEFSRWTKEQLEWRACASQRKRWMVLKQNKHVVVGEGLMRVAVAADSMPSLTQRLQVFESKLWWPLIAIAGCRDRAS